MSIPGKDNKRLGYNHHGGVGIVILGHGGVGGGGGKERPEVTSLARGGGQKLPSSGPAIWPNLSRGRLN
jgi:hypothetical protein